MRAYNDGVAFRYILPTQEDLQDFEIRAEATQFDVASDPLVMFDTLDGFTTSHESLYKRKPLSAVPPDKLMDMPVLLTWPGGPAAAITEARIRDFAGMYLEHSAENPDTLRCRLSPLPGNQRCASRGKLRS